MANETGDMKILGNYRRLIDILRADVTYQPSNALLKASQMELQLVAGSSAVEAIGVAIAPSKVAINERQSGFEDAVSLVRASKNMLKASGATEATLADAATFSRKVLGIRKSKKVVENPNTPALEASKNHSATQLSYDAVLGNFRSYTEVLKNDPLYSPNEDEFKTSTMETMANGLESLSNAVSNTFVPLKNSRTTRDELLYTNADSIVAVAQLAKAYYKAIYGATSPQYKSISGLIFNK
jgi:hypothetical protein